MSGASEDPSLDGQSMSLPALRECLLTVQDGVAVFSHQRPAVRNTMNAAMRDDYADMLTHVENDRDIRVLVVTGSGGSFCAGGDLKGMACAQAAEPSGQSVAGTYRGRLQSAHRWLDRLRSLDVPVIFAVDGPAFGAGASLALMGDFVLASTRAVFCLSFTKVGLVPDFGAFHTLPRLVGLAKAKELMMTGRRFDASEAKALGIVYETYDAEALQSEAYALARRLAAGPRDTLGMIRNSLNRSFETDYRTMAEIESHQQAVAMTLPDHAQALAAFMDKQPLPYDWDRP